MAREERHQLGQRAVEIAGKHRRHDAAGILLAADQRKIAVALALGRMADEALVLQNLEKRGDGGVLGVGFVGPGDDVVDHRIAQTPENLHDLSSPRVSSGCLFSMVVVFSRFRCHSVSSAVAALRRRPLDTPTFEVFREQAPCRPLCATRPRVPRRATGYVITAVAMPEHL